MARARLEVRSTSSRLVVGIDDEAGCERDLPLLASQPALRLVEQPFRLAVLTCGARDRDARALPDVVVVDLGDGRADSSLQLRLCRAKVVALLLERVRARKVQLARQDSDEAARHRLLTD